MGWYSLCGIRRCKFIWGGGYKCLWGKWGKRERVLVYFLVIGMVWYTPVFVLLASLVWCW